MAKEANSSRPFIRRNQKKIFLTQIQIAWYQYHRHFSLHQNGKNQLNGRNAMTNTKISILTRFQ